MPGIEPDITILRGHTLAFRADPCKVGPDAAVEFHSDGAVAMASGKIVAVGQAPDVIASHPGAALKTYANHLIMAGVVRFPHHLPPARHIASPRHHAHPPSLQTPTTLP